MNLILNKLLRSDSVKLEEQESSLVTFLNHYSYMISRRNKEVFEDFDIIYCDGILLATLMRIFGPKITRRSFDMTSLAPMIFSKARDNKYGVVLVGGIDGISCEAKAFYKREYPGIHIVSTYSGFFKDSEERNKVLSEIVNIEPEIVICGMGTPYQEYFLRDLKSKGWGGLGITCGGFFHQTVKKGITYYPNIIDRLNLRWAYRIYDEPKLVGRYTSGFVKFMFIFIYDYFVSKKTK